MLVSSLGSAHSSRQPRARNRAPGRVNSLFQAVLRLHDDFEPRGCYEMASSPRLQWWSWLWADSQDAAKEAHQRHEDCSEWDCPEQRYLE